MVPPAMAAVWCCVVAGLTPGGADAVARAAEVEVEGGVLVVVAVGSVSVVVEGNVAVKLGVLEDAKLGDFVEYVLAKSEGFSPIHGGKGTELVGLADVVASAAVRNWKMLYVVLMVPQPTEEKLLWAARQVSAMQLGRTGFELFHSELECGLDVTG